MIKKSELLGLSTILILIGHCMLPFYNTAWTIFQSICQVGVDVCLLLAGIGGSVSLQHNHVPGYYWHRVKRLILPLIFTIIVQHFVFFNTWGEAASYCTGLTFFTKGATAYWFVGVILALYIITPILHWLYQKSTLLFFVIIGVIAIVSAQISFDATNTLYTVNDLFFVRIPIYMIGIAIGQTHITIKIPWWTAIVALLAIILNLWFNTLPNKWIITHLLFIALAIYIVGVWKWTCPCLFNIGNVSFEIYLTFENCLIILILLTDNVWIAHLQALVCTLTISCVLYLIRKVIFIS